jgi:site-specific DNA-methyltransferase (adenine-specific)
MRWSDKITVTNEDNMQLMARYSDKYFDLAIVDPPYGIGRSGHNGVKAKNPKHNWKAHQWKDWDNEIPSIEYFKELFRVSKNQIIWGANYFTQYLPASMGCIFWDKGQDLTMSDGELAFTSFQVAMRKKIINRGQLLVEGGTQHPTQKPIKLYKWILDKYAKQGDKILDTHLGSGSIAIACHDYGFELTACELDTEYYEGAKKRFLNHSAQTKLFL